MTTPSPPSLKLSSATAYHVIAELGRGGMGTVFLALAEGPGGFERLVAVKRMHPHLVQNRKSIDRFLNEARLAAHVHHANVVGIQQVGSDGENYFLGLDYVDGEGLDVLVRRAADAGQKVPVGVALRIVLDALAGLGAVHDAEDPLGLPLGILHRDVSPHNVIVGRDGTARLADFGLAKCRDSKVCTDASYVAGKLLYAAPEYLRHEPVGRELDVYAIGVTMWTVLAGHEPLPDHSEAQLLSRVLLEGIPELDSDEGRIDQGLVDIVSRACAPDAPDRFHGAAEMANAIERLGRGTDLIASHAEVAAFLDAVLGAQLSIRRRRMASYIERVREEGRDSARTLTIRSSVAEAATVPPEAAAVGGPDVDAAPSHAENGGVPPRRVVPRAISFAATSLLIAFAATALRTQGEAPPSVAEAAFPVVHSAKAATMPFQEEAPAATPSRAEVRPEQSEPAETVATLDPPVKPRQAANKTRRAQPRRPALSDKINVVNPYR